MRNKVLWRSMFYALTVVLGMVLAYQQLRFPSAQKFWQVNAVILSVFIIELVINVQQHRQRFAGRIGAVSVGSSRTSKLINHFVLPIVAYVALAGFIYFNRGLTIVSLTVGGSFVMFTILFANIRSFYLHYSELELRTHYVYDIVKLILFFVVNDALFNLAGTGSYLYLAGIPIVSTILMLLMVNRYQQLHLSTLVLVMLLNIIISVIGIALFLSAPGMYLSAGVVTFVGFYLSTAVVHHFIHNDLGLQVIFEYLLVFILVSILVLGISLPG